MFLEYVPMGSKSSLWLWYNFAYQSTNILKVEKKQILPFCDYRDFNFDNIYFYAIFSSRKKLCQSYFYRYLPWMIISLISLYSWIGKKHKINKKTFWKLHLLSLLMNRSGIFLTDSPMY